MRCTPAFAEKSGYTGLVKLEVLVLARPKDQACMSQKNLLHKPRPLLAKQLVQPEHMPFGASAMHISGTAAEQQTLAASSRP